MFFSVLPAVAELSLPPSALSAHAPPAETLHLDSDEGTTDHDGETNDVWFGLQYLPRRVLAPACSPPSPPARTSQSAGFLREFHRE